MHIKIKNMMMPVTTPAIASFDNGLARSLGPEKGTVLLVLPPRVIFGKSMEL